MLSWSPACLGMTKKDMKKPRDEVGLGHSYLCAQNYQQRKHSHFTMCHFGQSIQIMWSLEADKLELTSTCSRLLAQKRSWHSVNKHINGKEWEGSHVKFILIRTMANVTWKTIDLERKFWKLQVCHRKITNMLSIALSGFSQLVKLGQYSLLYYITWYYLTLTKSKIFQTLDMIQQFGLRKIYAFSGQICIWRHFERWKNI